MPKKVDPRSILEAIACDESAAPTARVAACKALLALAVGEPVPEPEVRRARRQRRSSAVTADALRLLRGGQDDR